MTQPYTPETKHVRATYALGPTPADAKRGGEAFDRWLTNLLAAHDAEVSARTSAECVAIAERYLHRVNVVIEQLIDDLESEVAQ